MHPAKRIISQTAFGIGHIEVMVWRIKLPVQRQSKVAVWVDQAKPAPGSGVGQGEVQQERRFPGAGLPDQIEVVHSVSETNTERSVTMLVTGNAKRGGGRFHGAIVPCPGLSS